MTRTYPVQFMLWCVPASMSVVRNDGECWGVCAVEGVEYLIEGTRDLYDESDTVATAALIEAARASDALAADLRR